MSSYAAATEGIRNDTDNPIANSQTFLLTDFKIGFNERNKNAVKSGYEAI